MQTRLTLFCRIDALLLQEQLPCTCSLSHGHTDPCGGGLLACSGLQLGRRSTRILCHRRAQHASADSDVAGSDPPRTSHRLQKGAALSPSRSCSPRLSGEKCAQVSLGYFFFDTLWCLLSGGETWLMLAHHTSSIGACFSGLILHASGAELVGAIFGAEVTNPLLQARWFLLENGGKGSSALGRVEVCPLSAHSTQQQSGRASRCVVAARSRADACRVSATSKTAFAISFTLCRVFWAPTLLVPVLQSPSTHWCVRAGGVAMQLISWVWAASVLHKFSGAIRRRSRTGAASGDSERRTRLGRGGAGAGVANGKGVGTNGSVPHEKPE